MTVNTLVHVGTVALPGAVRRNDLLVCTPHACFLGRSMLVWTCHRRVGTPLYGTFDTLRAAAMRSGCGENCLPHTN